MNPISRVTSWYRRQLRDRELRSLNGGGGYVPSAPVLSGTYITPETALGLAALYSACNVISRDFAALPRNVYRILPGGGRVIDRGHRLQPVISTSPNKETDGFRFWQTSMNHVLTRGNGFSEIVRDKDGYPSSLHLLHPSKTIPKRANGGKGRLYYELIDGASRSQTVGGESRKIWADDVLHLAGMGFNGIQGYCPITVARQTIGVGVAAEQFAASLFGNGAIPKGIFKTAKRLGPGAADSLRRTINQVHQGAQNANQIMILAEGWDWVQTQFSPEDSQFLLTREFTVKEIARLYNLPPHKIGDYSESHLANVEEANLDYLTMTLAGWVVMAEAQMNHKLLSEEDRKTHVIAIDMSALMRANTTARTAYYQAMRNMGCFSADDILLAEGLNPIGPERGGDKYVVQGQYIPLDQVGQGPMPKPEGESSDSDPRISLNGEVHDQDA